MVAKNFIPLLEEEQVNSSKKTKLANNNESDVVSIGHSLNGNKYVSLPQRFKVISHPNEWTEIRPSQTCSYIVWDKCTNSASCDFESLNSSGVECSNEEYPDLLSQTTASLYKFVLRKWEPIRVPVPVSGTNILVCSYNVLCQDTANRHMYMYTHLSKNNNEGKMQWSYRSPMLAHEFCTIDADIVCLQEVQNDHYDNFYKFIFKAAGYHGEFKKKTGSSVDGCAIFYRSRFECLRYLPIEYYVDKNCILNRSNIGKGVYFIDNRQIMRLRDKLSGKEFCIANTHLLFNIKRSDIRIAQLIILLAHLDKECGFFAFKPCPAIICGDFNLSADSPVYKFLLGERVSLEQNDESVGSENNFNQYSSFDLVFRQLNIGKNCRFFHNIDDGDHSSCQRYWAHSFKLADAYAPLSPQQKDVVSSYSSVGASCPDFIFYSVQSKYSQWYGNVKKTEIFENDLYLHRRLSLPTLSSLQSTFGPWPNAATPSDHIPIVAEFTIDSYR
ncbi:unnamed protein product [Dracunculus medinensis]|uniref:Endo/exonuclease/phosphatase domain-containing protein n=1 Tax=Dracunculus medinensis TaxID=318479 RepID=A0A158Q4F3_DRAME|nr:unnamed protein product [Dracunculus medinensis]